MTCDHGTPLHQHCVLCATGQHTWTQSDGRLQELPSINKPINDNKARCMPVPQADRQQHELAELKRRVEALEKRIAKLGWGIP